MQSFVPALTTDKHLTGCAVRPAGRLESGQQKSTLGLTLRLGKFGVAICTLVVLQMGFLLPMALLISLRQIIGVYIPACFMTVLRWRAFSAKWTS